MGMNKYCVYERKSGPGKTLDRHTRLEEYSFIRLSGGRYRLFVQVGWNAGSHDDGAGNAFDLPGEWFSLPWERFLDRLEERFPAQTYGYGRREFTGMSGLKEFLGFR